MSRSPEVEDALKFRAHSWASEALAAEVERLEKRENELINALDMGQINCDAVYDELREEREDAKQRAEAAEAKNARLRAALEDVSLLAHCISKAGPLNTPDLETAWRKFDLISVKAAEALVDRKAVLNGGEASK